jgi:hypothetical protein
MSGCRQTEGGEEGDRRARHHLATSPSIVTEHHDDALNSTTPRDTAQVATLDDVLYRIASEINRVTADAGGRVPPPVSPPERAVQTELLVEDVESQDADTNGSVSL